MRKILGRDGGLDLGGERPRPIVSGSKSGEGGVKITNAEIPPDLPKRAGRYPFRIEGSAPRGVNLDDLSMLLEARFQGDPKFNLRHSKDEAVKRLKDRMEKRLEKLKVAEERANATASSLAEQKEKYDVTRDEIEKEALADLDTKRKRVQDGIDQAEREARGLRDQIVALNAELDDTQKNAEERRKSLEVAQDQALRALGTNAMAEPFITGDQAVDLAAALIDNWRSSLQEYDAMPLLSEFDDLAYAREIA